MKYEQKHAHIQIYALSTEEERVFKLELSPLGEGVCEEPLGGLVGEEERGVGGECSDEGGGEAAVEGGRALAGQDAASHPQHAALLTPHLQWSELSHIIQNIRDKRD